MILRKLVEKDAEFMYEWMTDDDVNNFFRFNKKKITLESCKEFIKNSFNDVDKHFAIEVNDQYAGTISLKHINSVDKNAEYAISLRRKFRGNGYGSESSIELLRIAFEELQLNKVYLNVLSDNENAIKMYTNVGFEYEGELKRHININGKYKNLKLYGIWRDSYEQKYKIN